MRIATLEETKDNLNETIRSQKDDLRLKTEDTDKLRKDYDNIRDELETKRKEYTKVSNEKNHSDERQRQLQEEVNALEVKENNYKNILRQLDNMSFMDRILGRYPEDIKELKGWVLFNSSTKLFLIIMTYSILKLLSQIFWLIFYNFFLIIFIFWYFI